MHQVNKGWLDHHNSRLSPWHSLLYIRGPISSTLFLISLPFPLECDWIISIHLSFYPNLPLYPLPCFFLFYLKTVPLQDLANSSSILEEEECNKRVVHALYEALNAGDVVTVQQLLAPDIEWWFHGPPSYQYLMQLLTGNSLGQRFEFVQQKITAFGSTVLAEGHSPDNKVSWVHAWTVNNGVITQVREYFNTSLLVTRLDHSSSPSSSSSSSFHYLPRLWESTLSGGKSMPGLVLAI